MSEQIKDEFWDLIIDRFPSGKCEGFKFERIVPKNFFGRIIISFQNGEVVALKKEETIKPK